MSSHVAHASGGQARGVFEHSNHAPGYATESSSWKVGHHVLSDWSPERTINYNLVFLCGM